MKKLSTMTPMKKDDVKLFEAESTPIENVYLHHLTPEIGLVDGLSFLNQMILLQGWYHKHGLPAGQSMRKHWGLLSKLLGFKPAYYAKYEYRTAIWGILWRDQKVMFAKSQRGLNIQVAGNFPHTLVIPLINELITQLS